MKMTLLSMALLWTLFANTGRAQQVQIMELPSLPLAITTSKTSHLVFPYSIKSVDKGSRDILAQISPGSKNILQIKAAKPGFNQTNLTVITEDESLYCFTISYQAEPKALSIRISPSHPAVPTQTSVKGNGSILLAAGQIESLDSGRPLARTSGQKASLALESLHVQSDILFFRIEIENDSPISYDIESLRFSITDKKQPKRTAVQQMDIKPIHIQSNTASVAAFSTHTFVFALPKFTISEKKYLAIGLLEKNGGRHLSLKIQGKTLLQAQPL